jgi:hypothetical protein
MSAHSHQLTCFVCSPATRKHKQGPSAALAQPDAFIQVSGGQLNTAGGA